MKTFTLELIADYALCLIMGCALAGLALLWFDIL